MVRSLALSATAAVILMLAACKSDSYRVRTYPMGQKVEVGHIVYTVFETEWLPQIGEGTAARIPQNRFFLVRLSVSNSGSAETMVPNMTIEDDNGRTYSELSDGTGVPQWIGYLRQVKPADSLEGNAVFDAPPRHYKLHVTDENMERTALIDIPLSFSAETPAVPAPGAVK